MKVNLRPKRLRPMGCQSKSVSFSLFSMCTSENRTSLQGTTFRNAKRLRRQGDREREREREREKEKEKERAFFFHWMAQLARIGNWDALFLCWEREKKRLDAPSEIKHRKRWVRKKWRLTIESRSHKSMDCICGSNLVAITLVLPSINQSCSTAWSQIRTVFSSW